LQGNAIGPADLRLRSRTPDEAPDAKDAAQADESARALPLPAHLDGVERDLILRALSETGFNRSAAAKRLGITFRQLRYRMQRLGIRDPATEPPG